MARITVEDCLAKVENLFELVLLASKRARSLANGAQPMLELENDKPTVVALREIASGHITPALLDEEEVPEIDLTAPPTPEDLAVRPMGLRE